MLHDITIGRYLNTSSPIHKADARTKILSSAAYSAAVIMSGSFLQMTVVCIFTLSAIIASKIPVRFIVKGLKPLWLFILLTFILNIFAGEGDALWQWHALRITYSGVYKAFIVALRLVFFICGSSLLTLTTPPVTLTDGLSRLMSPLKVINAPVNDIAMIISITLRCIPEFADEADRIMKAQRARGANFSHGGIFTRAKSIISIIVPLFISVFCRADELALAMDARCYGKGTRKPRKKTHFGRIDALIASITVIFCIFLGIINFFH